LKRHGSNASHVRAQSALLHSEIDEHSLRSLVSAEDRLELQGSSTPSSSVVNGDTILTSSRSFTVDGTTATVTAKYNQTNGVLDLSTTAAQSEPFWQQVLRNVLANAIRFAPEGSSIVIEWRAAPGGKSST
jgi:signal transduction histidine kinase